MDNESYNKKVKIPIENLQRDSSGLRQELNAEILARIAGESGESSKLSLINYLRAWKLDRRGINSPEGYNGMIGQLGFNIAVSSFISAYDTTQNLKWDMQLSSTPDAGYSVVELKRPSVTSWMAYPSGDPIFYWNGESPYPVDTETGSGYTITFNPNFVGYCNGWYAAAFLIRKNFAVTISSDIFNIKFIFGVSGMDPLPNYDDYESAATMQVEVGNNSRIMIRHSRTHLSSYSTGIYLNDILILVQYNREWQNISAWEINFDNTSTNILFNGDIIYSSSSVKAASTTFDGWFEYGCSSLDHSYGGNFYIDEIEINEDVLVAYSSTTWYNSKHIAEGRQTTGGIRIDTDGNITLQENKFVDTVDVSSHTHTGGPGQGRKLSHIDALTDTGTKTHAQIETQLNTIGVDTATLRTDLTAETSSRTVADYNLGAATGTLRTDLIAEISSRTILTGHLASTQTWTGGNTYLQDLNINSNKKLTMNGVGGNVYNYYDENNNWWRFFISGVEMMRFEY